MLDVEHCNLVTRRQLVRVNVVKLQARRKESSVAIDQIASLA